VIPGHEIQEGISQELQTLIVGGREGRVLIEIGTVYESLPEEGIVLEGNVYGLLQLG